jgi:membrane-bound metal-dependent hydrolase YbcI (DUF457 family)
VGKNGKNSRRQVIGNTPFVGPFAGRRVVFVVEQSKTKVLVDSVKTGGTVPLWPCRVSNEVLLLQVYPLHTHTQC